MHGRDLILSLIPHQGGMCLLDEVVSWDAGWLHCRTGSHQLADNPLRDAGGLRAVHLCEYGAQAMAVHGGLLAREHGGRARPGLLVSLRGVDVHADTIDQLDGLLDVEAEQLMASDTSWQYRFKVRHGDRILAEGRAAVMMLPAASDDAADSPTPASRKPADD